MSALLGNQAVLRYPELFARAPNGMSMKSWDITKSQQELHSRISKSLVSPLALLMPPFSKLAEIFYTGSKQIHLLPPATKQPVQQLIPSNINPVVTSMDTSKLDHGCLKRSELDYNMPLDSQKMSPICHLGALFVEIALVDADHIAHMTQGPSQ